MLASALLNIAMPWPMKVLIDNVLGGHPLHGWQATLFAVLPGSSTTANLLTWALVATVVLFLAGWALSLAQSVVGTRLGQRMTYDVAGDLVDRLQQLSMKFHSAHSAGDLVRRVTVDSTCVATIVQGALLPSVVAVISLVSMLLVMAKISLTLTLASLGVIPLFLLGIRHLSERMAMRSYEQQEADSRIYEVIEQTISGLGTVQAFGREPLKDARFSHATEEALRTTVAATSSQMHFKIWMGASTALSSALIIWLGAEQALSGHVSVGDIVVFLSYLAAMYAPLESLSYMSSTIQGASGSVTRVMEVLGADPDVVDGPGARAVGRVAGGVSLEGVVFGYAPGRPVLRGVSLEVAAGETVAVVGATGAGKSTLMSLLLRFYDPQQGRVCVDGVDVRELTLASLRAQVGLVLQESFLFPVSIADNIAFGKPGATRAEVIAAATAANAHEFISALPAGYDTVVGERGATLSGGERQRVAIARALVKDAPILILDEPTSSLDAVTEAALLDALDTLMAGRTTFVIAHRLSTIRRADRIIVLDHGQIVETGTHTALLTHPGHYATLWHLQHEMAG